MEIGGSFCGFSAAQLWQDFYLWEHMLNEASAGLVGIVELGTASGGFAIYLETQAKYRGLEFATFDSIDPALDPVDHLFGRPTERRPVPPLPQFQKVELLKQGAAPEVLRCLDHGPVALLCDNGDKALEVSLYGPHLAEGSLCVVHDWQREFFPADVPEYLAELHGGLCDELGAWSRVFERVAA